MAIHWVLLVAVIVIQLQILLFKRFALRRISYERYFDRNACFAGEQVQLIERTANRKLLPVPWLRLEAVMSAHLGFQGQSDMGINSGEIFQNHTSLFSLMSYTEITRRHVVDCKHRGYFVLNSVTMTSGDLLGVVSVHKQLHLDSRLIVYPRPVPIEEVPLPSSSWLGELVVRRWIIEDPFYLMGVREYRDGDALNSIHWKATARTGRLQVNQRAFTADHRLLLLLNIEDSEGMWNVVTNSELIEQGITYAASIADYTIRLGIPTGFSSNGRLIDGPLRTPVYVASDTGMSHLGLIFEAMAKLELRRSIPCEDLLMECADRGDSNLDIVLITTYVNDKINVAIDRLQTLSNRVEILRLSDNLVGKTEVNDADEAV